MKIFSGLRKKILETLSWHGLVKFDPYCPECGSCGYTECCGIESFLEKHVAGKTNCIHEEQIVREILALFKEQDELYRKLDKLEKLIVTQDNNEK